MAQHLRVPTALPKDSATDYNSSVRGFNILLWLLQYLNTVSKLG